MAISLSRTALQLVLGRRCVLGSSINRLFATDDNGPKNKKTDLQSLLDKMKDKRSLQTDKDNFKLKAQPSKKISSADDSSSSSSSDSSDSDEEPLDIETDKITEKAAAHTAMKANLDTDKTEVLKSSMKNDLTRQLKAMRKETKAARDESEVSGTSENMEQLFGNLKVLKETKRPTNTSIVEVELTPEQKRFLQQRRELRLSQKLKREAEDHKPIDLFNQEQPLNIFKLGQGSSQVKLNTWKIAADRELRILRTQPPRNLIEDMVAMTEKGILWHFPIDNEQGINENEVFRKEFNLAEYFI